MKNLLLVVAFMLSMGAFAHESKSTAIDQGRYLCYYATNFEPDCPLKVVTATGFADHPHAKYILNICGSHVGSMGSKALLQKVQDFICENGYFPSYVEVVYEEFI